MRSILLGIVRICSSLFKCSCLKKKKLFLNFSFRLWNLHQISNFFEKKMIVIANVLTQLQNVKDLVEKLSWQHSFRTSFHSEHVNGCQTLVKSTWKQFYHLFSSLWSEMIRKISPLLKSEILRVFVNTLTADDKDHVQDCEDLQLLVQMQLS